MTRPTPPDLLLEHGYPERLPPWPMTPEELVAPAVQDDFAATAAFARTTAVEWLVAGRAWAAGVTSAENGVDRSCGVRVRCRAPRSPIRPSMRSTATAARSRGRSTGWAGAVIAR